MSRAVTLSFFRFEGVADRLWAFGQMGFARRHLKALPDLEFFKLFGTGTGEGFDPKPDFGQYAILGTWPSHAAAAERIAGAAVYDRYRARAAQHWTLHLTPLRCWGEWAGAQPFAVQEGASDEALAVLTRATLKPRNIARFWRRVPGISARIGENRDVIFKQGLGEVPWTNQVTFSLWPDLEAMRAFAYGDGPHRDAIAQVREHGWFREELYARFRVERSVGGLDGIETGRLAA
jgi:spheroidene monooxygenase